MTTNLIMPIARRAFYFTKNPASARVKIVGNEKSQAATFFSEGLTSSRL